MTRTSNRRYEERLKSDPVRYERIRGRERATRLARVAAETPTERTQRLRVHAEWARGFFARMTPDERRDYRERTNKARFREVAYRRTSDEIHKSFLLGVETILERPLAFREALGLLMAVHAFSVGRASQHAVKFLDADVPAGMRRCYECGKVRPYTDDNFAISRVEKRKLRRSEQKKVPAGNRIGSYGHRCRGCIVRAVEGHRERVKEKRLKSYAALSKSDPYMLRAMLLSGNVRARARRHGTPIDPDLVRPDHIYRLLKRGCPVCGVEFDVTLGESASNVRRRASLDRLIPKLGYVSGNVAIICQRCNSIKNDASLEELERVATWLRSVS